MKPKEKAIELYNKFRNENSVMTSNVRAKKQALIAVNLVLSVLFQHHEIDYWKEVKSEIEALS